MIHRRSKSRSQILLNNFLIIACTIQFFSSMFDCKKLQKLLELSNAKTILTLMEPLIL
jgi:hypothetical protein